MMRENEPEITGSADAIGLSLSGGGFRATIFHLGVISCLRDHKLLGRLKIVTSVSGGSVLAAHMAKEWASYNGDSNQFATVADELLDLVVLDLRGRVIRRWLIGTLLILPKFFGLLSFHKLMSRTLDRLYDKTTIHALRGSTDKPSFHVLATSITTGQLCKFTSESFTVIPEFGSTIDTPCSTVPLSVAVAASAAFPPLFPPVPISKETLNTDEKRLPHTHYLTDGGIYDNLGLNELWREASSGGVGALLVSDAGANFDWSVGKRYIGIVARNVRTTDIIMDRVSKLVPTPMINKGLPLVHLYIGKELRTDDCYWKQSPAIQTAVRNTRTDLDSFSEAEIISIARHAYSVTSRQLLESGLISEIAQCTWDKIADAQHEVDLKLLRNTARRRLRLFAWRDWAFYGLAALVIAWFWVLPGPSNYLKDLFKEYFVPNVFISINIDNDSDQPFSGDAFLINGGGPSLSATPTHLDSRGNAYLTGDVPYNGYFAVAIEPPHTPVTFGAGHSSHVLVLKVRRGKIESYEGQSEIENFYSGLRLANPNYGTNFHIQIKYLPESLGFK
jgi:predicted acylesterase/phospholipase RssA